MLIASCDVAEVFGPTLTPESVLPGAEQKMNGSLFVIEASSIEEVKTIVEGDPFYANNIVSPLPPRYSSGTPLTRHDSGTKKSWSLRP